MAARAARRPSSGRRDGSAAASAASGRSKPLEVAEALALLARVGAGGLAVSCLSVRPLVAAVLLRLGRRERSGRTPALIARTESRDRPPAPVEANGAPLSERSTTGRPCRGGVQDRPDMGAIGPRHRLAAQKVAAVRIRQGQGLAPRAVAGSEPALEVDAPHLVGRSARRKRRRARRRAPAHPALHRQALAIERDPIVLAAGHASPDRDAAPGPNLHRTRGCARRTARHAPAISSDSECGRPARASGPIAPRRPPADSAQTTCNRPAGSPRSGGRSRQTSRRHHKTHRLSTAQVSFQVGKRLLADHQTCYPCRQSILLPM